jgi:hypothetical protein
VVGAFLSCLVFPIGGCLLGPVVLLAWTVPPLALYGGAATVFVTATAVGSGSQRPAAVAGGRPRS